MDAAIIIDKGGPSYGIFGDAMGLTRVIFIASFQGVWQFFAEKPPDRFTGVRQIQQRADFFDI